MTRAFVNRQSIGAPLPLTVHQSGVAACILDAMSNKEISRAMGHTEGQTEVHVSNMMARLQARNRVDLALKLDRMARDEE